MNQIHTQRHLIAARLECIFAILLGLVAILAPGVKMVALLNGVEEAALDKWTAPYLGTVGILLLWLLFRLHCSSANHRQARERA